MQVRRKGAPNSMVKHNRARHTFLKCNVRKKEEDFSCMMKVGLNFLCPCFSFKISQNYIVDEGI